MPAGRSSAPASPASQGSSTRSPGRRRAGWWISAPSAASGASPWLNASGQVVGYSTTPGDVQIHAVLWQSIAKLGCKATLAGCNLKGVNLAGAYLPGANLSGSNLKGANLTNANLAGANLKGANVKDVIWSNTICPDGTNSDANGATCVK